MPLHRYAAVLLAAAMVPLWACPAMAAAPVAAPMDRAAAWRAIAALPDWGGVWVPDIKDQARQETANAPPWNAVAQKKIDGLWAEEHGGTPRGLFVNCLPEAMPSWMLISHNAMELLLTPGRVTILGELDGNRLRRIYTDGRPHPEDPDLTFHGHSTGKWEGDTLVVDTVGILPQSYIAISESVGIPNNGDMHIVERIHLVSPDEMHFDMEIDAPKILSKTWKTTRIWRRDARGAVADIVEGNCLQGSFTDGTDAAGDSIFVPVPQTAAGNPAIAK